MNEATRSLKNNVISVGRLLWEKELVSGLNGNISIRDGNESILITGRGTCLGLLQEKDILTLNLERGVPEGGIPSSESRMHLAVYKEFPEIKALVHSHTHYANAYFLDHAEFESSIFESQLYLGKVQGLLQKTPCVTDLHAVTAAFRRNSVVALRNHGIITGGRELFDCFLLIQALEDALRVASLRETFRVPLQAAERRRALEGSGLPGRGVAGGEILAADHLTVLEKRFHEDVALQSSLRDEVQPYSVVFDIEDEERRFLLQCSPAGCCWKEPRDGAGDFHFQAPRRIWEYVIFQQMNPLVAAVQKRMSFQGSLSHMAEHFQSLRPIMEILQQTPPPSRVERFS